MGGPPDKLGLALRFLDVEELFEELASQRVSYLIDQKSIRQKHTSSSFDQMGPSMRQVQSVQLGGLNRG